MTVASLPVRPGELIGGRYRVDRVLGQGGMAVVVAARDERLEETVAIKVLLPDRAANSDARERFVREARTAVKIKNEHVVRVTDVGDLPDGLPYMVMEYLEGEDLATMLARKKRVPAPTAMFYVLQVCSALNEAHALGVVHRDLKPANLFLAKKRGQPPSLKILDFGISKVEHYDRRRTETKEILGSPWYMAPEQMKRAASADARSDVWSLGIILHELVTGDVPFDGATMTEVIVTVLHDEPQISHVGDMPPSLERVIRKCLQKAPEQRYTSADDLAAALREADLPMAEAPPHAVDDDDGEIVDESELIPSVTPPEVQLSAPPRQLSVTPHPRSVVPQSSRSLAPQSSRGGPPQLPAIVPPPSSRGVPSPLAPSVAPVSPRTASAPPPSVAPQPSRSAAHDLPPSSVVPQTRPSVAPPVRQSSVTPPPSSVVPAARQPSAPPRPSPSVTPKAPSVAPLSPRSAPPPSVAPAARQSARPEAPVSVAPQTPSMLSTERHPSFPPQPATDDSPVSGALDALEKLENAPPKAPSVAPRDPQQDRQSSLPPEQTQLSLPPQKTQHSQPPAKTTAAAAIAEAAAAIRAQEEQLAAEVEMLPSEPPPPPGEPTDPTTAPVASASSSDERRRTTTRPRTRPVSSITAASPVATSVEEKPETPWKTYAGIAAAIALVGIGLASSRHDDSAAKPGKDPEPTTTSTVATQAVTATPPPTVTTAGPAVTATTIPVATATTPSAAPTPVVVQPPAHTPAAVAPGAAAAPVAIAKAPAATPAAPVAGGAKPRIDLSNLVGGAAAPAVPAAAAAEEDDNTVVSNETRRHYTALKQTCWDASDKTTFIVTVAASVTPSGTVTSANGSASDAQLARCVADQVKTWSFPPSKRARSLQIPVRFRR